MNREEIINIFRNLTVWKRGDERAPNKPLLILYALGKYQNGHKKLLFKNIDSPIQQLLINFGPSRQAYHPEYPFWRLQNDDIWVLENSENVTARKGNTDAKKFELNKYNVIGSFSQKIQTALDADPSLIIEIAKVILNNHFPDSLHEDIVSEASLTLETLEDYKKKTRDPEFRNRVLRAYSYQCAICGLNIQSRNEHLGVEAAHIMWHQAGGPDIESNGLTLCSMHHKFFDRGAVTINNEYRICISQEVYGTFGLDDWLLKYHGSPIRNPIEKEFAPDPKYLDWHLKQVFKQPARSMS